MTYDFELDLVSDNSNSVILRQIKPHTQIFEFGPAYGRMTKYLSENLKCNVSIAEFDEVAGKIAAQFSHSSLIGTAGDLTRPDFPWDNPVYDTVIFADVLEHIIQPQQYLQSAKNLLKPDGSIWISIPNIGHNSVLIDLWNNKFEYRDVGLLDRTHVTFFTRKSLTEMVSKSGLQIVQQHDLINSVGNTEFGNSYTDVPNFIADFMKIRTDAEVYQFVWELKAL